MSTPSPRISTPSSPIGSANPHACSEPGAWCPELDTSGSAIARRNLLVGLWAGRRLGFSGDALIAYAQGVHRADFERPGEEDVIEKIARDFVQAGIELPAEQIAAQLTACYRDALRQVHTTD